MKLRIKEFRKGRGLTQQQLGEAVGLSKPFVSQLERGEREPSAQSLQAFADYFGVKIADLFQTGEAEDIAALAEVHAQLSPTARAQLLQIAVTLLGEPGK